MILIQPRRVIAFKLTHKGESYFEDWYSRVKMRLVKRQGIQKVYNAKLGRVGYISN